MSPNGTDVTIDLTWWLENFPADSITFTLGRGIRIAGGDGVEVVGKDERDVHYQTKFSNPLHLQYVVPETALISLPESGYLEVSHQHHWLPDVQGERYERPFTYAVEYVGPEAFSFYGLGERTVTDRSTTVESSKPTTIASLFLSRVVEDVSLKDIRVVNFVDSLTTADLDSLRVLGEAVGAFYGELFPEHPVDPATVYVCPTDIRQPTSLTSYATEESAFRLGYVARRRSLEYAFAHEMAHFWWNFGAGDNAGPNGFLNESFAQYSSYLFYREVHGESAFRELIEGVREQLHWAGLIITGEERYASPGSATQMLYGVGPVILYDLHRQLGDADFLAFLSAVLQRRPETLPEFADWLKTTYAGDARFAEFTERVSG
ncbi:hypothetical protein [Lewinella sp. IMCC34191]|uniref:hypothetical protein n=1 Tax=Lewinella sp. IMCC34191 TaxID=2259172 RepID=UPI000E220E33|nr:hypothetical protein [Lewinella sp. IMCC34191]